MLFQVVFNAVIGLGFAALRAKTKSILAGIIIHIILDMNGIFAAEIPMARTSAVDSATSQFFINLVDNDFLNFRAPTPQFYGYCVFGKVVEGMDVVDAIAETPTGTRGMHRDVPLENITILDVTE